MHTNRADRAETRSIAIAAPPERVLEIVGDARRLPDWAPEFARSVRPDGDGDDWIVDNGSAEFPIRLRVAAELGTVDILGRTDPLRGAFARVIPNGAGSEFLFTLVFPSATDPAAVAAQMDTIDAELDIVRALSEADATTRPSDR